MSTSLHTRDYAYSATWSLSLRHALAMLLRAASRKLARMSRTLSTTRHPRAPERAPEILEFYAEAGAPEGALYIDGKLVGYLPGITRL